MKMRSQSKLSSSNRWSREFLIFFSGILIVISSFIIGKITTFIFILKFNSEFYRWLSIIVYILSWLMLFVGILMCGSEGYRIVKQVLKYFTIRHYHQKIRQSMKKRAIKKRKKLKIRLQKKKR